MRTPLSLRLYRLATGLLEPLAPTLLRRRARLGKEDSARIGERLGRASVTRPEGPLVWLHGASVGESLSLLPLIDRLRAARPDLVLLVTSGTVTSAELLARRAPPGVIHQFAPVDAPGAVARFLAHWRPALAVFVESEVWPNLLMAARTQGARLALLSARLSSASLAGWARRPAAARALFSGFDLVMAQTDAVAEGLVRLGARDDGRLNLKLAGEPLAVDPGRLAGLRQAAAGRPVLLASSTHAGEEQIVLEAFEGLADALLVIVPRHPARGGEIAALSQDAGLASRSDAFGRNPIYIADKLGELGEWFTLADSSLVGGSLLPGPGGHNPIEPAQLDCPILTGPHLDNWADVYAALAAADAVETVADAAALHRAWAAALADPASSKRRAERARAVVAEGATGLDAAVAALLKLVA